MTGGIPEPDPLPSALAEAFVNASGRLGRLGRPLLFFRTIGSTNDVGTTLASTGQGEGAVIVADAQTAGRGRRGRTWFSAPESGLYVSVVLEPSRAPAFAERATTLLTLAAGVALSEAVLAASGLQTEIKWPNDLLVNRRKVAGILAEGVGHGGASGLDAVVLGYGVNVGLAAYPPDLRDRATSIESELGRAVDRGALFVESLVRLEQRYEDLLQGRFDAILDRWRDLAPGSTGARVSWHTAAGPKTGTTCGIDENGALLVRVGTTVERIVAGEVSWV